MMKDEWIRAAMTDDSMVVQLLVRLKQAHSSPPSKSPVLLTPFKWGLRLPRSRPALRCDAVASRKEGDSTRGSPTTPLSWSGGASHSTDGFETSSLPTNRSPAARSKGTATSETAATTSRRSRKKKTFAELKEEESLLMKERIYLKRDLASLRATVKEERAKNERFKKLKLDLGLKFPNKSTTYGEAHCDEVPQPDSCISREEDASQERYFVLPDLNMMPSEVDFGSEMS